MPAKKDILIYGIGNEILTDDGIGPKLVKKIQASGSFINVDFETSFLGGLEILEFITGYKQVFFIDAIKTRNGVPGDVYLMTPEDFQETLHLSNLHDIKFLNALKLGYKLGMQVPDQIQIIAIEIIEDLTFGNQFSMEIEEKFDCIYAEIIEHLQDAIPDHLQNIKTNRYGYVQP